MAGTTVSFTKNPISTCGGNFNESREVNNWYHKISSTYGFDAASFDIYDDQAGLEDFFVNAISRQVIRYTPDGQRVVWEGYIHEMTMNLPATRQRVSLDDMYNRIRIRYVPVSGNPPTEGTETSTCPASDANSQAKYGVKEYVLRPANNRMLASSACQLCNVVLQEYREPRPSTDVVTGGEPSISVTCKGYIHTLDWRVYNQTAACNSGSSFAETMFREIVSASNNFAQFVVNFNPGAPYAIVNQTPYPNQINRDETALSVLQNIASLGQNDFSRYLVYMSEGRIINYLPSNTGPVTYFRRMSDPRQEIYDQYGRSVPYWEIRPNNWLRTTDLYSQYTTPPLLRDDKQSMYIESVEYREPDSLTLNGSLSSRLQIIMARQAAKGDALL